MFSQVTNPPIDPIREHLVMSLITSIGPKANLLSEKPEARLVVTLADSLVPFALKHRACYTC